MLDWSALLGEWPDGVPESHNVAPGQMVAGFTLDGGHAMRWGLIPAWSDDFSGKYSTFNARVETVTTKPAYRGAWRHANRCLLPALGYYEWQQQPSGKQPHFIRSTDGQPLLFAGLYEPARGADIPMSCTMLTCAARQDLAALHPRMPLMFSIQQGQSWLQADAEEAGRMLDEITHLGITTYAVSKRVNYSRNDGNDLIEPLGS
jgi:putative SOS response-associated peptidase YedK